jgi:hypothetical protein
VGQKPKASAGKAADASSLTTLDPIPLDRPVVRRAQKAIARAVASAFATCADAVVRQVTAALDGVHKVDTPEQADGSGSADELTPAVDVTALIDSLDLSSLDVIVDAVEPSLFDVALDGGRKAIAQVGARNADGLVNQVNTAAADFARDRSAELVGKRWTADGDLIDSPRPGMAITDATRESLRGLIAKGLDDNIGTPAIADSIEEAYAFGAQRAGVIARTEVANANAQGKLEGWRAARDTAGVKLQKTWQTSNNTDTCPTCEENEAAGPIDLEDDFPSGDDAEPGHPGCECATTVEVAEPESEGDDDG